MILFDVFFGKLFNFNIFIMIKYLGSNGKKMGRYAKCNFNNKQKPFKELILMNIVHIIYNWKIHLKSPDIFSK